MSTPRRPSPPLEVRERATCMCGHGGVCSSYAPGHALHLIQSRLASATPSEWIDAIVETVDLSTGDIVVRSLDGTEAFALWNAERATQELEEGAPVALHGRYDVLAAGTRRFNVLRLS